MTHPDINLDIPGLRPTDDPDLFCEEIHELLADSGYSEDLRDIIIDMGRIPHSQFSSRLIKAIKALRADAAEETVKKLEIRHTLAISDQYEGQ